MNPDSLVPENKYVVLDEVTVCFYEGDDCLMPDAPNLPAGTVLTYQGRDNDADGGFVFTDLEGTKFCLHEDDLLYINFAAE